VDRYRITRGDDAFNRRIKALNVWNGTVSDAFVDLNPNEKAVFRCRSRRYTTNKPEGLLLLTRSRCLDTNATPQPAKQGPDSRKKHYNVVMVSIVTSELHSWMINKRNSLIAYSFHVDADE
jgi:hypothetical protein